MTWTAPRTWVAGETVDETIMNTHVRDNLKAIGDAWTSYTPTLTNWTLGNGTLAGAAMQAGKLVHFRIKLTVGSTTTPSAALIFNLPATANLAVADALIGTAHLFDTSSATRRYYPIRLDTTSKVQPVNPDGTGVTATSPWTWATGDVCQIVGTYEAA